MKQIKLTAITFVSIFILFFAPIVRGGSEDTWRPVDPKELAQKESKIEKDADAEAIFWDVSYENSVFEYLKTKTYVRVKIFNERGRDQFSKVDLYYATGGKIEGLTARVIKPDGSIIEVKNTGIFERIIVQASGRKVKAKSFVVPSLENGSILEYRYSEFRPFGPYLLKLSFQKDIPAQSITNCAKMVTVYRAGNFFYTGYRPDSFNIAKRQAFNMDNIEFVNKEGFYCATKQNVPAFHSEPMMPPEGFTRQFVLFDYFADIAESFAPTFWGLLAGEFYKYFKRSIEPTDDVKRVAAQVIGGAKTDDEKLALLYEFCKTQIRNVNYDYTMTQDQREKFKPSKSVSETLKRKTGTSIDINFLFFSLAMAAGFDARLAFTGNRNEFFSATQQQQQSFSFLDFNCIGVRIGNDVRYFDPASFYIPVGMLPWALENQTSLLIGPRSMFWHETPLSPFNKNIERRSGKFKLTDEGTLEGEIRMEFTGYIGAFYKQENDEITQAERENKLKELIKRKATTAELSDIRIENAQDPIKNFIYIFNVRVPNYANKTGKRLFLQPNFFEYGGNPLFLSNTRTNPVYFNYPWAEEDDIEIELPQGFEIENADSPKTISSFIFSGISDDVKIATFNDGQKLTYKRRFKFGSDGQILFKPDSYSLLKNLFDNIHKTDTHTVILKQK